LFPFLFPYFKNSLFSGGAAGSLASCITNPLEVIKTQLQSSSTTGPVTSIAQKIFKENGLLGFWKGMKPTLVGIIPARSIYFYSYEQTKRALGQNLLPEGSIPNALVSGFMAGICSNTVTNPIWMVKTRYQLLADHSAGQKVYTSYSDAISTIMKEEGIGGFYRGIFASYWGCLEGAVQFILYEQLKTNLLMKQNEERKAMGLPETDKLPKLKYFCSAAFAKGVAAIVTYPHEVARTRLREQARGGLFKYNGMWQTIGLIGREEGRSGLYAGMGVHLLKVVPNSAIMFLTYEIVNSWLAQFTITDE
jgi:solute carrier family 25 protein 33/36